MSESGYLKFDEVTCFKMDGHHEDQGSQFIATRSEGTSGISIKVWDADSRRGWDRFVKAAEAMRAIGG